METFTLGQMVFAATVIVAAFAVRGATGFGCAAVAVPLAALALPASLFIPVVANLQLVSTLDHGARNWRNVVWREMVRIAPFLITGVLIGLYLFSRLDAAVIAKGLGAFVVAYAIFTMATAARTDDAARRLPWPSAIGLNATGAAIGALFGSASSPFYAIYLRALRLSRDGFRATMTTVILMQVVLRIAGYAGLGVFTKTALAVTAAAPPSCSSARSWATSLPHGSMRPRSIASSA